MRQFDRFCRWLLSVPIAVIGLGFSFVSEWLVRLAAWLADMED